jgi:hypothetical protein
MAVLVISYAREDKPLVHAVVALLDTAMGDVVTKAVFWDEHLVPGQPWFEQIAHHIDEAPRVFVFWCRHAAASKEMKREFVYALDRSKQVVPVLLDDTPLAPELAPMHGLDLRGAVRHAPRSFWRSTVTGFIALLGLFALAGRAASCQPTPGPVSDDTSLGIVVLLFVAWGVLRAFEVKRASRSAALNADAHERVVAEFSTYFPRASDS